jgi:heat shock protein HslJ
MTSYNGASSRKYGNAGSDTTTYFAWINRRFVGLIFLALIAGCANGPQQASRDGAITASPSLLNTTWLLEDLGGAGVLDWARATLAFTEPGKVAGSGSCNRFFGGVTLSGQSITFGQLGSTRMACVPAVATQEANYLKALADAERFVLDGSFLLIYAKGMDKPLRFTRTTP